MLLGGEFLDYAHLSKVLPVSPEMARYHAMLGVEIGVGFTVTAIVFALYANLSTDGRMRGLKVVHVFVPKCHDTNQHFGGKYNREYEVSNHHLK